MLGERAMSRLEPVAPTRHVRSIRCRPTRCDARTNRGQHSICAIEKQDVARPTVGAEAPMARMCRGSVLIAIPSPSSCTNTDSVIGKTDRGSRVSSSAAAAAAAAHRGAGATLRCLGNLGAKLLRCKGASGRCNADALHSSAPNSMACGLDRVGREKAHATTSRASGSRWGMAAPVLVPTKARGCDLRVHIYTVPVPVPAPGEDRYRPVGVSSKMRNPSVTTVSRLPRGGQAPATPCSEHTGFLVVTIGHRPADARDPGSRPVLPHRTYTLPTAVRVLVGGAPRA